MKSQAEVFCEEFKKCLDKICPTKLITHYGILTKLCFEDGSWVGIQRIFTESGHFSDEIKS